MPLKNIELLELVANTLGEELNQQVVYIGGSTTALLVAPERRGQVRQTKDVDIVIDVLSTHDYYAFCDQLKAKGFKEDQSEDALICRYCLREFPDVRLDIMPTDERILGFSNRWYSATIETASVKSLGRVSIKVADPVYFLATKFEAWHGRGGGDIFAHDIEDILFVLEHRPQVVDEVQKAKSDVREYLSRQARSLLETNLINYLNGFTDTESAAIDIQNRLFRISRL